MSAILNAKDRRVESEEYYSRIVALRIESFTNFTINTVKEAQSWLKSVRDTQKQLRQIKKEINLEIREIRAAYREKSSSAGAGGAAFLYLSGKKRWARSYSATSKRMVAQDRDARIAPYEQLKIAIDQGLLMLDKVKVQLVEYIDESKKPALPTVPPPSEIPTFCPNCGFRIEMGDAFCRSCGHRLA